MEKFDEISTDVLEDLVNRSGITQLAVYTQKGFCLDLEKDVAALGLEVKACYVNVSGEFDLLQVNEIAEKVQNGLGKNVDVIFGRMIPGGEQYVQLVMELDNK